MQARISRQWLREPINIEGNYSDKIESPPKNSWSSYDETSPR